MATVIVGWVISIVVTWLLATFAVLAGFAVAQGNLKLYRTPVKKAVKDSPVPPVGALPPVVEPRVEVVERIKIRERLMTEEGLGPSEADKVADQITKLGRTLLARTNR